MRTAIQTLFDSRLSELGHSASAWHKIAGSFFIKECDFTRECVENYLDEPLLGARLAEILAAKIRKGAITRKAKYKLFKKSVLQYEKETLAGR